MWLNKERPLNLKGVRGKIAPTGLYFEKRQKPSYYSHFVVLRDVAGKTRGSERRDVLRFLWGHRRGSIALNMNYTGRQLDCTSHTECCLD